MESVLKSIATSSNLERVLFSPSLKKLYFNMAIAAGGATQFKHVDSVRKGLSFAADKAEDKKRTLLFCSADELMGGYDLMIEIASKMLPVVVLGLRSGMPDTGEENWSYLHLRETGWIQFHTHTLQETYDHLAMAYHACAVQKMRIPIMILHSSLNHDCLGEYTPREDLDMGNPLTGLQSSRVGKTMSFEEAFAKMKHKSEKDTLSGIYKPLIGNLRDLYKEIDYQLPEDGLPLKGAIFENDTAIISLIPAKSPDDENRICRMLCYRPFSAGSMTESLKNKKKIVVVEPQPSPGSVPVFHAEIMAQLGTEYNGEIISATYPPHVTSLTTNQLDELERK